ncbi:hypothetical protein FRC12_004862 [Ceratobasidium sp. 428]|nr:hypothetical protein FRC12_004862 [Ceratobasidium sp. 428]
MQTIINFVMAQYERFLRLSFFNPGHWQVKTVRDDVSWRLQSSEIARWVLFMGAKIFESVLDGTSADRITTFERWIIRMDDSVNTALSRRSTVAERQIQLTGQLELAFFKFRFTGGSNCYVIFRNSASIFLQMVFLDPSLWPNRTLPPYLGARISVAHALATTCYELGHFVILDAVCAMVYGLPQTVQYDTSTPAFKTHAYPIEWLHGCPPELLIVFAEINQRFAERYILGPVQPWDDLEQRLKAWEAPLRTEPREDSCKAVARLAIQEGWRQALLAYLYMSVCGLRSDDLRVRAAVQQIFRLIGTIQCDGPTMMKIQLFGQYMIAGACTHLENQRALVRTRLACVDNNLWLYRGADYVPILDHLWHGAAANGRPILWDDYINSRRAALPVAGID